MSKSLTKMILIPYERYKSLTSMCKENSSEASSTRDTPPKNSLPELKGQASIKAPPPGKPIHTSEVEIGNHSPPINTPPVDSDTSAVKSVWAKYWVSPR